MRIESWAASLVLGFCAFSHAGAFTGQYSFERPPNGEWTDGSIDTADVTLTRFAQGGGLTASSARGIKPGAPDGTAEDSAAWAAGQAYTTIKYTSTFQGNDYVTFSLAAAENKTFSLSSVAFDYRRSSSGPKEFRMDVVGTKVNGSLSERTAASGTYVNNDKWHRATLSGLGLAELTQITLKLYGWNASSESASLRLDNLAIGGTSYELSPVPEMGTASLVGGLLAAAGAVRRRASRA